MPANRYFNLPTLGRQLTVIAAAVIGYGLLVGLGDFYFPDLSDAAKKKLTQIGLVSLYLASLSAGLAFVWSSKAKHNLRNAEATRANEIQHIALLRSQEKLLNTSFAGEIARREAEIAEADRQSNIVSDLPKVFDYSGALSLVLTAIGTALCFIGAG
jgi:hypothetical protein